MERLEKELNSFAGLDRYELQKDERLKFAKAEKNARMRAEGHI